MRIYKLEAETTTAEQPTQMHAMELNRGIRDAGVPVYCCGKRCIRSSRECLVTALSRHGGFFFL